MIGTSVIKKLRIPGIANIADILKIALMLIKATFKDWLKIKRIRNYALKHDFYLYFPI